MDAAVRSLPQEGGLGVSSAAERARVRAAMECACTVCGGPCWGKYRRGAFQPALRCKECVRREATSRRPLQPQGLRYQWGCP